MDEIHDEIEKLQIKKVDLINRINITSDYDEKENLRAGLDRIETQIDTLERFKKK